MAESTVRDRRTRVRFSHPRMIKLLLFDFHGTLAYMKKFDLGKLFNYLGAFGLYPKTRKEKKFLAKKLSAFWSQAKNWTDFSRKLLKNYIKKPASSLVFGLAGFMKENIIFKLYNDVEEIIGLPFKKAILSGSSRFLIEGLGLEKFFTIFTPRETKFLKPDQRAFLAPLKKLKVKPEEVIMIGDDIERDLIPAQNLGLKTILVDRENKIRNPKIKKIRTLKDLKNYLI